jgi:hypothetical protein
MKSVAFKVLGLACALVAGAGNLSAANLQTLLDRSPFAPSGAAAAAAGPQAEQGTLEFRGMVTDGGGTSYSVFDTTANKGRWVREGDDSGPFKVKSYDAATNTLEIEQDGRATKLSLKRATIQAGAPVSAMMAAPAPANGVVAPGGGDQKRAEPAAADARRLEAVAAEVRRRRALRNAGKPQQGQPTTPVPAPAPAPADAAAPAPVITP